MSAAAPRPGLRVGALALRAPTLLAPMADVSDLALRTICEEHGAGLTVTEFLSAHALSAGAARIVGKMVASEDGRPFGVQVFGRDPEMLARAAEMAVGAGAALVDVNMGCPARRVIADECGAALMREPPLAQAIVRAVCRAVPADVPVTVKHRAGWDDRQLNAPEFACAVVEAGAALVTVHGRTRAQGFSGVCDLGVIRRVREAVPAAVPVVGNGDVVDVEGYLRMRAETGCDAVMIGRGALGNPWLFRRILAVEEGRPDPGPAPVAERIATFRRHAHLALAHAAPARRVAELRKVCAWYAKGMARANALRRRLCALREAAPILAEAEAFLAAGARAVGRDGPLDFRDAPAANGKAS